MICIKKTVLIMSSIINGSFYIVLFLPVFILFVEGISEALILPCLAKQIDRQYRVYGRDLQSNIPRGSVIAIKNIIYR